MCGCGGGGGGVGRFFTFYVTRGKWPFFDRISNYMECFHEPHRWVRFVEGMSLI